MMEPAEETPLENIDPKWIDHPLVQELIQRSKEVGNQIGMFQFDLALIDPERLELEAKKEELRLKYLQDLKKIEGKIGDLSVKKQKITQELWSVQKLQEQVQREIGDTIEGLSAMDELAASQAEWEKILSSQTWLWIESIFHFQKIGCEFIASGLHRNLFGVLLADQMGLGKTLQATAAINLLQYTEDFEDYMYARCPRLPAPVEINGPTDVAHHPSLYSVLWITPNAIKGSTMREIAKWSNDLNVIKLEGDAEQRAHIVKFAQDNGMVLVCSYEQLRQRKDEDLTPALFEVDWPIVVTDEAHKYKNPDTSTFVNVERIAKNAGFFIPMTGTPILNRPLEFWSILHMLTLKGKYLDKFDTLRHFEDEYLYVWGSHGGDYRPGAYDKLVNSVSDMVLRRRKDEVLTDLPEKIREFRYVNLTGKQRLMYQDWRDKMFLWLDEEKSDFITANSILAHMTRLRQIALLPAGVKVVDLETKAETILDCWESAKIDEAMGIIEELLEADEKVLIFSNFNDPLRRVKELVEYGDWTFNGERIECGMIIGGVKEEKRAEVADRFNDPNDNLRVVCGNIAAMGTGLNLQGACSHSIFLDLFWNPGINEQAEDRLHRQGQKNNVTIHIIQAEDTIDAFVMAKLEEKQGIIEGVVERSELRRALQQGLI